MTQKSSNRFFAVILTVVLVFSGIAYAGMGGGIQQDSVAGTSTTDQPGATIDPAVQNAKGTVTVFVRLGQPTTDVTASRQATIGTLKRHADRTQQPVVGFAKQHADSITVLNQFWITNAVLVRVDTSEINLKKVAAIEGVRRVSPNPSLRIPKPVKSERKNGGDGQASATREVNTTYGLDQINAPEVWSEYDTKGEGVKVAVLDTGVDIEHPDIDLYTSNESNSTYPGGWAEFNGEGEQIPGSEPHDTAEHGTHTSGTVSGGNASGEYIGVAPNVQLMHGLVIPGGGGSLAQITGGIQWAVANDADVISMSFGPRGGGFLPGLIAPIQNAQAAGVIPVASSGNSGAGTSGTPGNIYETVAVGASNENRGIASFSSGMEVETGTDWGSDAPEAWPDSYIVPDVAAPGVDVKSSVPGIGYAEISGTSMAAPHVAGTFALILSAGGDDLTVSEAKNALYNTTFKPENCSPSCTPRNGNDTRYGTGIIDAAAAVESVDVIPEHELGDVNEDGSVNVQDVRLVQRYLAGTLDQATFNEDLADLDRDEEVTRADLRLLQRKVQGRLDPAQITVSNLSAPDEVQQGETITVNATITNDGEEGALQNIGYRITESGGNLSNVEPSETQSVDLAPGETKTVSFEIATDDLGGDYSHGVFSNSDASIGGITILGSHLSVSDLSAPAEVEQGETFDVTATIENSGNVEDTQTVEYRFAGETSRTKNVTLGADESTTITFGNITTSDKSGGTYEHGVYTADDAATTNITVLEAQFDVEIADAPRNATVGETITVNATVENTGNATDEQVVSYSLDRGEIDVAVVDSDEGYGEQVLTTLEEELPAQYNLTLIEDQNAMGAVGEYDVFVMQDVNPSDLDVQAFVEATNTPEIGVVWLDGWGSGSDAIAELSAATGDPASTSDNDDGGLPVTYTVTQDHPIFDGVAEPGEEIPIHNADYADRSWFGNYSGQVLATVSAQNNPEGGSAMGVDSSGSTVLASTLGREQYVQNEDFTEESNQLLANSVRWASSGAASSDMTAQNETESRVTLAPGESTTVEFTYTVPQLDISIDWVHTVMSEDDMDRKPVSIDVDRGSVEGTVTDATGDPIEGATVSVDVGIDDGNYTVVTGSNGTYRIEGVPAGTHNITASIDGYTAVTKSIDVPQNGTASVDFTLTPKNGSISGTVTASDTGEQVANVTVSAEDENGNVYTATTGENGTYTIDVPPGNYVVTVADTPGDFQPQDIVTVDPGKAVTGVDFQVTPRDGAIDGYVRNAAGEPIAGAHVIDADQSTFNVTTNESGYYRIEGLDRGTYALRVKSEGYNASDITFVEVKANETTTQNVTLGAFFEVSNLTGPSEAEQGQNITVNATITNVGTEKVTRSVYYFPPGTDFGGNILAAESDLSKQVTLDGGESTRVTFTYQVSESREPGEYRHGISADEVEATLINIMAAEGSGEASFELSDLSAPSEAEPGGEITVNATVTNTGNATGTQTITYNFNNTTEGSSNVTLAPGENTTVEFNYTVPTGAGTYQHSIATDNDRQRASLTVGASEPEPAYFAVSNVSGPSESAPGEEITVNATITNTGDEQGTQSIFFFFMEASATNETDLTELGTQEMVGQFQPSAARQVTLDGSESTRVTFTYQIPEDKAPGAYVYAVSSLQETKDHPVTVLEESGSQQQASMATEH